MPFLQEVLNFLNTRWETPKLYGTFHLICLFLMFATAVLLCVLWKKGIITNVRNVVLVTAIIVLVFEIYKQINYTFSVTDTGIVASYRWYAFPWQFCSTPLYIGLLAGLTRGRPHKHFCAYLATYALFAGLAVMLYPGDVFTPTLGICIQTMICHGSMVVIAIFLYYTGHVSTEWSTLWKAAPLFGINLSIAVTLNELAHIAGITENHNFNMFYISRWKDSTLPVYSSVHNAIMKNNPKLYPLCILIYMLGFTLVAAIMLLIARGIQRIATADYDAEYAEMDARRQERIKKRNEKIQMLEERRRAELEAEREEKKKKKEEKKKRREEKRKEKREERREERKDRREERRDEFREEMERRRRARRNKRKERRKERREERREEARERRRELQERRKERERNKKRLEERMKEIEKREKKLEKERKKQAKQEKKERELAKKAKKRAKQERKEYEKALKKWIKKQKKLGFNYSIEDFNDYYYR